MQSSLWTVPFLGLLLNACQYPPLCYTILFQLPISLFSPTQPYQLWLATFSLAYSLTYYTISTYPPLLFGLYGYIPSSALSTVLLAALENLLWCLFSCYHLHLFPVVQQSPRPLPVLVRHTLALDQSHYYNTYFDSNVNVGICWDRIHLAYFGFTLSYYFWCECSPRAVFWNFYAKVRILI